MEREQERVQMAKIVRETEYAYKQALAAADSATRLQDRLESEANAKDHLANLKGLAEHVGQRSVDIQQGRLAAQTALEKSRGSQENLRLKHLAYQSALQKYQHRLSSDALVKIGANPQLIIDVQVTVDKELQPKVYRFDSSLTGLIESSGIIPNHDVNAELKKQLELLDKALLDSKDPTPYRRAIDALKKAPAGAEAALFAPLHEATHLDEFQSPTRITQTTRYLKKKRDKLQAQQRFAEADDVQREIDDLVYTQPTSANVAANINKLLRLLLLDKTLTLGGKKVVVWGHEWLKSKYQPFGFQLRRREIGVRVVQPPDMHLDTFQALLKGYADAVGDHVNVPDVSQHEMDIEAFFVDPDANSAPALTAKEMTGGRTVLAAAKDFGANLDDALNAPATKYNSAILAGIEAVMYSPLKAAAWASNASGLSDFARETIQSSAGLGAAYEALRADPINPYAIFRYVLKNPTQYGTFKDISWNHHIGRYTRIPTQEGTCRAFIYEYLAYRVSIYNEFFLPTRYSGYADLPFMVGTRKNSRLIHTLLNTRFDPDLQEHLVGLLKAWRDYDKRVYHRAARIMHFDALILRFLCREVLLRTLTETACAINILAVKLLMRQAAACRNRDNSFECVRKLSQMAAKLITKKLDPLPSLHTRPPPAPTQKPRVVHETPLLQTLAVLNYKVNGTEVTVPVEEVGCPEEILANKDQYLGEPGRYISLLEEEVAKLKADSKARLYMSFSHAPPCANLTHAVLTSKLELYEERMKEMIEGARLPRDEINRLHAMLEANVLDAAKNVLAGKTPFQTTYAYAPKLLRNLTEYKCKSHKPPVFDSWYTDLNKLHEAYSADLTSLFTPVAELVRTIQGLYASDTTKTPFQAFNQLDYAISAYEFLVDSCAQTYDARSFEPAEKKRDLDTATGYLRTLLDIMDGATRSVDPPQIQLAKYVTDENTEPIVAILTDPTAEIAVNLHMPMKLDSKKVWSMYLDKLDNQDEATEFLKSVGNLESNAFVAHELYDEIPGLIRTHNYVKAIQYLRMILSFNVYRYNWNQFFKLPTLKAQREQLEYLLENMSESFRKELRTLSTHELRNNDSREDILALAQAYKDTIHARMKQVLQYLYVLNMAIGNRDEAYGYQKRAKENDFSGYYASIDAKRAGQSVFDIRTTFRADEMWTIQALLAKVRDLTPTTKSSAQIRLAFLLQFGKDIPWNDPNIDYLQMMVLLSPDHFLNRIVQHVSTALFPDETEIDRARKFVAKLMYTYRKNAYPTDNPAHGNELIRLALNDLPPEKSELSNRVNAEIAAFKPTQQRREAMKYIQRSNRARENLWPGENRSILSKLTENLPYLDGEYTLNIVVQVNVLSETHPLVILKNKKDKNCQEKTQERNLLQNVLFSKVKKPKAAPKVVEPFASVPQANPVPSPALPPPPMVSSAKPPALSPAKPPASKPNTPPASTPPAKSMKPPANGIAASEPSAPK